MEQITVFGSPRCPDTLRSTAWMDGKGVGYEFRNVDEDDQARTEAEARNGGRLKMPIITFEASDEQLVEPSNEELESTLTSMQLMP